MQPVFIQRIFSVWFIFCEKSVDSVLREKEQRTKWSWQSPHEPRTWLAPTVSLLSFHGFTQLCLVTRKEDRERGMLLQSIKKEWVHREWGFAEVLMLSSASRKSPSREQPYFPSGERQPSSREQRKRMCVKITSLVSGRFWMFVSGCIWDICLWLTFLDKPGVCVLCVYIPCLPQA